MKLVLGMPLFGHNVCKKQKKKERLLLNLSYSNLYLVYAKHNFPFSDGAKRL